MFETGFFASVKYRYDPKSSGAVDGYAVTLQITEEPPRTQIVLDIPGQEEEQLWQHLKSSDPFIDRQIPDNERAAAYFRHAVEAALRESNHASELTMKTEANLRTGKTWTICRPAHVPKIVAMQFEGNKAISTGVLEAILARVAEGEEYTEREFRNLLELNLRPRYEELGRLTVAFRRVKMTGAGEGAVAVTTVIEEGPVWRLGKVVLTGDALPVGPMVEAARFREGSPANWKEFLRSIQNMEGVLRRDGYIRVASNPVRSFREAEQVVDVTVEVKKGQQFLFGELHIEGLDPDAEPRVARLWKLPGGDPMNEFYINEFLGNAMPVLKGKAKSVRSDMHPRAGSNVVDVTITFR